jgi:hypothetical protein
MFDGNQTDHTESSAADLRDYLAQLQAERALASLEGLDRHPAYVADLDEALAEAERAYVLAALIEIASLRADIDGALVG